MREIIRILNKRVAESCDNAIVNGYTQFLDGDAFDLAEDMVTADADVERMFLEEVSIEEVAAAITLWQCGKVTHFSDSLEDELGFMLDRFYDRQSGVLINRWLDRKGWVSTKPVTLTGGRAVFGVAPDKEESDWDWLMETDEVEAAIAALVDAGFTLEGDLHYKDALGQNSFFSMRRKKINVIITNDREFAERHRLATHVVVKLQLRLREERLVVFKAILYGETYG